MCGCFDLVFGVWLRFKVEKRRTVVAAACSRPDGTAETTRQRRQAVQRYDLWRKQGFICRPLIEETALGS